MTPDTDRNLQLFQRAQKVIPGGVNSPVRAFKAVGGIPRFVSRALGPHFWDANGKRYIDYIGSWGPMILGYSHPRMVARLRQQVEKPLSYGAQHRLEIAVAEKIQFMVPCAERVAFTRHFFFGCW